MPCKRNTKCAQTHGQTAGGTWERPRAGRRILVHIPPTVPIIRPSLWNSVLGKHRLACIRRVFSSLHPHLCLLLVFCWNAAYPAPSSHLQDYFILRRARAQTEKEPALWIPDQPLSTCSLPHYPHISIMTPLLPVFLVVLPRLWSATCVPTMEKTASNPCDAQPWPPTA
ncbi:ly-6/neurotoxin-like protein 1 isoform X1 [Peromyscus californicus insignis]|uniref:ly-6/neurotoxin-like protein 1 isoform X1 n=1 Tax=Peromyscus californicus insignis TaxID=564181 RepID=UPI0022A759D9|nr:ly-6/neurotoxin-like protein 1 isoform X1 [Peromyscus californicus insignis]